MESNSLDLLSIYGIPPARYSEDNPNDLFLKNLPSLEQIAAFNLASQQNSKPQTQGTGVASLPDISTMSTPATSIGYYPSDTSNATTMQNQGTMSMGQTSDITQMITDFSKPYPVTAESIQYMNGFIRTQIGRRVQIQFLMGNAELIEKDGFLLGVGANYILINEIGTNDITACDFFNIKFIRFLY